MLKNDIKEEDLHPKEAFTYEEAYFNDADRELSELHEEDEEEPVRGRKLEETKMKNKEKKENDDSPDDAVFDRRIVDRSFTNIGYVGYKDGINLNKLDTGANW